MKKLGFECGIPAAINRAYAAGRYALAFYLEAKEHRRLTDGPWTDELARLAKLSREEGHRTNMIINGKPLIWADGRRVVPGDIKPGQTISFDPFTGVVTSHGS